jgi:hypothetical protein
MLFTTIMFALIVFTTAWPFYKKWRNGRTTATPRRADPAKELRP